MIYGYARVSTDGQSVAAQVAALQAAGAGKVFREVASGAKTDRAQLRKAVTALNAGDVLMVTRLDRLARSTRDLLNTLAAITASNAGFRSLGDAWADTTTAHGRLMLTVLGGLAEFERDLIRTRTGEGRARAVARGQKMGRPPKLTPHMATQRAPTPTQDTAPVRPGGTMSSATFWRLVDRLQLPDVEALELIAYAGKIGPSGKRPRFRLSTRQTHLASYLPEIEAALQAIGEAPGWLVRRNRSVPFRGCSPVKLMAERGGKGMGDVLQFLNRAVLRRSLR